MNAAGAGPLTADQIGDEHADPAAVARAIALRLLESRPRTRHELALALRRRNVPDPVAQDVLDRFTAAGLIDDGAFAAAWVSSRHAGRGLGRRALVAELRRKGVDAEEIEAAVGQVSAETEQAAAQALVERRLRSMRGLDQRTATRRLLGMLARKGVDGETASRVVRTALEEQPGSDG